MIGSIKILHWNCRSIHSASTDLLYLSCKFNPDIIALQETWLSAHNSFYLPNFRSFRLDRPSKGGGLAFFVNNKISSKIKTSYKSISPECEIFALDITLPGCSPFSLVNLYFPLGVQDTRCLDMAVSSWCTEKIMVGDFNSHHTSWGFRTDQCGQRLWDWSIDHNLSCLNARTPTFIRDRSRSALDLSFISSGISSVSWTTLDCATNSDHLPVLFEISCPIIPSYSQARTFINYSKFKNDLEVALTTPTEDNDENKAMKLSAVIKRTFKKAEFSIESDTRKPCSQWWNSECSRDHRRRQAAWKQLIHNQSPKNWADYKFIAATFKRTVAKAKEDYDKKHFDFLSKPRNKKALFRYMRSRKILPSLANSDYDRLSTEEMTNSLEAIGRGLANRFSSTLTINWQKSSIKTDYEKVTLSEMSSVIRNLPSSAPGPDGITVPMIKILFQISPGDVLNLINYSLSNAWIPHDWKIARVIPILKKQGSGFNIDNIRPISLTSHLIKIIERVLNNRIKVWMADKLILKPFQIGFRSECSIWCAHADLESRIQLARKRRQYAVLVTLDIAKAYDSVEHSILLNSLHECDFPRYIVDWVAEFLKSREFYCAKDGCHSSKFKQQRGVPQGAVLSPLLFNVLMSSIPIERDITVYIYADDIAFFVADSDIYSLHQKLQKYMYSLEIWLHSISLSLNISKSALLVFPIADSIQISVLYNQEPIPQVESIKYLGIIYNEKLNWSPHIDYIVAKAQRASGLLRRLSNRKYGLRRHTLLMIYKMYMRPILEFGCILFSGGPTYKIKPLVLLEREALRLCLRLPRYVAINVLYQEARIPTILCRFRILTVQTYLKFYGLSARRSAYAFISDPDAFFLAHWPRFRTPQIIFVQKKLESIKVDIRSVIGTKALNHNITIECDEIFPPLSKFQSSSYLNDRLEDYIAHAEIKNIIATDASVNKEKAAVGIVSDYLGWSFSVRLPDFTPVFEAELLAIILALRKLPSNEESAMIITDSLSLCTTLTASEQSRALATLQTLVPPHVKFLKLVWVPGHCGIRLNEIADSLSRATLDGPVISVLPESEHIVSIRYRKWAIYTDIMENITKYTDYQHLTYPWKPQWSQSKKLEVILTKFRCRVPPLNFYLHRAGLAISPLCPFCEETETIEHYFITCKNYSLIRKRLLIVPFQAVGLNLTADNVLSFGAFSLGHCHRSVFDAVCNFIRESKRMS